MFTIGKRPKTKSIYVRLIAPILSLTSTFSLLFLIFRDMGIIRSGDYPQSVITALVIESVLLFLLPCLFNPQAIKKRLGDPEKKTKKVKPKDFDVKIEQLIRFTNTYTPNAIVKCPKCKFENSSRSKICLNCGYMMNF